MPEPLVSVIIPSVRLDAHFFEALDSVVNQTYRSLEIIVVLDGLASAGDESKFQDDRIRLRILKSRVGTPLALNHGAACASGKYIARLDADDIAAPTRFAAQVNALESSPALICIGSSVKLIDMNGRGIGELLAPAGPRNIARSLLTKNVMIHSSVMYRVESFNMIGGYNPTCTRMQDYDLFLRLAAIGDIDNLESFLTSYRVHPGQHSRNSSPWARYTREVLRARLMFAEHEGQSRLRQIARNVAWFGAQVARHYGLRAPGYLRGAQSPR